MVVGQRGTGEGKADNIAVSLRTTNREEDKRHGDVKQRTKIGEVGDVAVSRRGTWERKASSVVLGGVDLGLEKEVIAWEPQRRRGDTKSKGKCGWQEP